MGDGVRGWGGGGEVLGRVGCEHRFATRGSPKRKEGVLSADFGVTYVFRMASQYFSTSISALLYLKLPLPLLGFAWCA